MKEIHYICLIKKRILFFTLLTAISFSFLASAIEPIFSSPQEVALEDSFNVVIETTSTETNYDIKIFVKNEAGEIISEIENDGWKNPYYYLKEVFPSKKEFKIRVLKEHGEKNICLRMRESSKQTFEEACNSITIIESNKQESSEEKIKSSEELIPPSKEEIDKKIEEVVQKEKNIEEPQAQKLIKTEAEKILLNSQAKQDLPKEFTTKENSKRELIPYIFIGFCLIIIILLALKKL